MNGRTALEGATEHGRLDMVSMLLKAGASRGGRDQEQLSRAMDFAEENGYPYIADLLTRYASNRTLSSGGATCEEFFDFDLHDAD